MKSDSVTRRTATLGDAAVSGLLAGGGAGVVMMLYLVAVGLTQGEAFGATLGRFDAGVVGPGGSPVVGLLAHLATSGVYGALFGMGWHLLGRRWRRNPAATLIAGAVFGLALLAVAQWIILPGTDSALKEFSLAPFALAHLLYGLALGWLIGRAAARAQ